MRGRVRLLRLRSAGHISNVTDAVSDHRLKAGHFAANLIFHKPAVLPLFPSMCLGLFSDITSPAPRAVFSLLPGIAMNGGRSTIINRCEPHRPIPIRKRPLLGNLRFHQVRDFLGRLRFDAAQC